MSTALPAAKKKADALKSALSKAESQVKTAEMRVKDKKADTNKEYKSQRQKELSELQGYANKEDQASMYFLDAISSPPDKTGSSSRRRSLARFHYY